MTDQALIAQLLGALTRLKIEITLSDIDMAYIESHFRPHLNVAEEAIAAAEGRMPNVYSIAAAEAREGGETVEVDRKTLQLLKASINGECYMGAAWEYDTISALFAKGV